MLRFKTILTLSAFWGARLAWADVDVNASYASLCLQDECAFYNGAGELQFMKKKGEISEPEFNDNVARVYSLNHDGKQGLIDRQGHWLVEPKYDDITLSEQDGLFFVEQEGKLGLIDRTGAVLAPFEYDNITLFGPKPAAVVQKNGQWVVDFPQGRITAAEIEQMEEEAMAQMEEEDEKATQEAVDDFFFEDNGLKVMQDEQERYGIVNRAGEVIVPFEYDWISTFGDLEVATVVKDGKGGYVNAQGEFVIPLVLGPADMFYAPNGLLTVNHENSDRASYDQRGQKVVWVEKVCHGQAEVLKNQKGEILLPRDVKTLPCTL